MGRAVCFTRVLVPHKESRGLTHVCYSGGVYTLTARARDPGTGMRERILYTRVRGRGDVYTRVRGRGNAYAGAGAVTHTRARERSRSRTRVRGSGHVAVTYTRARERSHTRVRGTLGRDGAPRQPRP